MGNTNAVLELIRCGAKKTVVGVWGTPLHLAAMHCHVATVKALQKAGCPVTTVDGKCSNVLHAAAEGGSTYVIM